MGQQRLRVAARATAGGSLTGPSAATFAGCQTPRLTAAPSAPSPPRSMAPQADSSRSRNCRAPWRGCLARDQRGRSSCVAGACERGTCGSTPAAVFRSGRCRDAAPP